MWSVRLSLIVTGGTIAWHTEERRMLSGAELVAASGERVDVLIDLKSVPSWDLSVSDMIEIASCVLHEIDAGADTVIVTHGTDTMEETAWLTELMLGSARRQQSSVLFTGAMRLADHPEADGPENLARAIRHGREARWKGHGVQVVWSGVGHPARSVRKIDADSMDPFTSRPPSEAAGQLPEPGPTINPDVVVVKVGPLARPQLAAAAGLVLEGTGASHVPSTLHPRIEELVAKGVPVVLASRASDVDRTAAAPGPVLYAGDLTAEKAALALMVGLGRHPELRQLGEWWSTMLAAG
jgi:L-asparaginase